MNKRSAGFTLVETLVVLMVGALVMGSVYQMVIMQDRTTRSQFARIETSQNARTSLAVIASDLKELSAVDGDVVAAAPTDLTVRSLRKAALTCNKPSASEFEVWELGAHFAVGDSVVVFSEGNVNSTADDAWVRGAVTAVTNATVCATDPYGVGAAFRKRLTMSVNMAAAGGGALIRSYIPTRFRITDTGEWGQLMRTDTTAETAIIDHLALTADGGLRFRYFNAAGTEIAAGALSTNLNNIMRIMVSVKGKAATVVSKTGANRFQDSLMTNVYLRGNFRTQ